MNAQEYLISDFEEWDSTGVFYLPVGWDVHDQLCPQNISRSADSFKGNYSLELGENCEDHTFYDLITGRIITNEFNTDVLESLSFYYKLSLTENYISTQVGCLRVFLRYYGNGEIIDHQFLEIRQTEDVSEWEEVILELEIDSNAEVVDSMWLVLYCGFCDTGFGLIGGSTCNFDELHFKLDTSTSIENTPSGEFRISPNPFSDHIFIESNVETDYILHNLEGKKIVRSQVSAHNFEIDTKSLEQGVYFISLIGEGNQIFDTRKIVKY